MDAHIFSAETLIPVSFVVTIIGGVVWFTRVYTNGVELKSSLANAVRRIDELENKFNGINVRLARIEEKIDLLLNNKS